jgi:hypothetical protein
MASWFRSLLYMAALINLIGTYVFSPFGTIARRRIALPIADSLYLNMLALTMLLFALSFYHLARTGRENRLFILEAAVSKLGFAVLLLSYYLSVQGTLLILEMALIVLYLAGAFFVWLWLGRQKKPS